MLLMLYPHTQMKHIIAMLFVVILVLSWNANAQEYTPKQRYIEIEYNKLVSNPNQEIVASLDTPKWLIEEYLTVQKDLNEIIGGYNRYVMVFWNLEGSVEDQKLILGKLQELKFSGHEGGYTIEEILQVGLPHWLWRLGKLFQRSFRPLLNLYSVY